MTYKFLIPVDSQHQQLIYYVIMSSIGSKAQVYVIVHRLLLALTNQQDPPGTVNLMDGHLAVQQCRQETAQEPCSAIGNAVWAVSPHWILRDHLVQPPCPARPSPCPGPCPAKTWQLWTPANKLRTLTQKVTETKRRHGMTVTNEIRL